MWWIGDNYAGNLGPQRNQRLKPFQHLRARRGCKWAAAPTIGVTPFPARYGLWASVARETLNGTYGATPFGTAESVDIKTALRSYTMLGRAHDVPGRPRRLDRSRQGCRHRGVGSRPYEVPTAALKDLQCELTLFRGKVVYGNAK